MKYCSEVCLHYIKFFIANQYTYIEYINKNVPTGNFIIMFHYLTKHMGIEQAEVIFVRYFPI